MKALVTSLIALALVTGLAHAQSDPAPDEQPSVEQRVRTHVRRAKRLRDFGYPDLAKTQLAKARKLDPTDKDLLLASIALYLKSGGDINETSRYVATLGKLYSDDFDALFTVANFLFLTARPAMPPNPEKPETFQAAEDRMNAELPVFRECAKFIAKPTGDLPSSAQRDTRLSLTWLARCAKIIPDNADVAFLAAQEIDFRARAWDRWSQSHSALHAFRTSAKELWELALPLYDTAAKSDAYRQRVHIARSQLYYRLGRFDDAYQEAYRVEVVSPGLIVVTNTLLAVGNAKRDIDIVVEALEHQDKRENDSASKVDLSAAKRIRDNAWDFGLWQAYFALFSMTHNNRVSSLRALITEQPAFLEVYYVEAETLMTLADNETDPTLKSRWYTAAMKSLERTKDLDQTLPDVNRLRAACHWKLGEFELAANAYDKVAKAIPSDTMAANYARAARDIHAGKYTAMDFEQYLATEPAGQLTTKIKLLRAIVTRSPKFFAAQVKMGELAFYLGDYQTAYNGYSAASKLEPDNLLSLDGWARSAMRTGRYDEALEKFTLLESKNADYRDPTRWKNLMSEISRGSDARKRAFKLWMESQATGLTPTERKRKIETSVQSDPNFCEALVSLAATQRATNPIGAHDVLRQALKNARDKWSRADVRRETGRLLFHQQLFERSASEFEAAYREDPENGRDLLMAALANQRLGNQKESSALMRRLFSEHPKTSLLRPTLAEAQFIGATPKTSDNTMAVSPQWEAGSNISFGVFLNVFNEGGEETGRELKLEYTMNVEVLETARHQGAWKLRISFDDPPSEEFNQLTMLKFDLQISPWFGIINPPETSETLVQVVGPAIQALTESLTIGLGDAPLPTPTVWKNTFTQGPPHFDNTAKEVVWLDEAFDDSFKITRKAVAGRLAQESPDATTSRLIVADATFAESTFEPRSVSVLISKKELTRERNDVIMSRLSVRLERK